MNNIFYEKTKILFKTEEKLFPQVMIKDLETKFLNKKQQEKTESEKEENSRNEKEKKQKQKQK